MDPPVTYDDGDQSPLKGEKAQFLRNQWAEGMDYNPSTNPWVSDWCKVLWCGDYQGMMDILRNKTEEETIHHDDDWKKCFLFLQKFNL